jgi:hypothetical protein
MKALNTRLLSSLALIAGLGMSGSAHAVWTFDNSAINNTTTFTGITNCSNTSATTGGACASGTTKVDSTSLNLAGYAITNGTNNVGFASGATWGTAPMTDYSGYGIGINSDGTTVPNHAIDNNGNTEAVLMSFSSSVALTSIGIGYTASQYCQSNANSSVITFPSTTDTCPTGYSLISTQTDGTSGVDISVLAWTGSGAPTVSSQSMTGWTLVGNYGNIGVDTTNPYNVINSSGITSSYWLISAYNTGFSTLSNANTQSVGSLTSGDDYFKLYAAAGTTCAYTLTNGNCVAPSTGKLPEPTSLALTSVALFGALGLRRRRQKREA